MVLHLTNLTPPPTQIGLEALEKMFKNFEETLISHANDVRLKLVRGFEEEEYG